MDVYVYQAALWCEECTSEICLEINLPQGADIENESSWDSDDYPKGPYNDGGGEADCPQHCDSCHIFLENPLTGDGVAYVLDSLASYMSKDDCELGDSLRAQYVSDRAQDDGQAILAQWALHYDYIWNQ